MYVRVRDVVHSEAATTQAEAARLDRAIHPQSIAARRRATSANVPATSTVELGHSQVGFDAAAAVAQRCVHHVACHRARGHDRTQGVSLALAHARAHAAGTLWTHGPPNPRTTQASKNAK
jgi:hypothetical protein